MREGRLSVSASPCKTQKHIVKQRYGRFAGAATDGGIDRVVPSRSVGSQRGGRYKTRNSKNKSHTRFFFSRHPTPHNSMAPAETMQRKFIVGECADGRTRREAQGRRKCGAARQKAIARRAPSCVESDPAVFWRTKSRPPPHYFAHLAPPSSHTHHHDGSHRRQLEGGEWERRGQTEQKTKTDALP